MTDYPVKAYLHGSGETYGRYFPDILNYFHGLTCEEYGHITEAIKACKKYDSCVCKVVEANIFPFPGAVPGRVYQREEVEVVWQYHTPNMEGYWNYYKPSLGETNWETGYVREYPHRNIEEFKQKHPKCGTRQIFELYQQESAERCNQQGLITENDQQNKVETQYLTCENGKVFPMSEIRKQGGLKREIVDLCLSAAAPDDDCMLADFLMALQYILDKYSKVEVETLHEAAKEYASNQRPVKMSIYKAFKAGAEWQKKQQST